ncbi:MAG: DNA polymerase II [Candidatus Kuenenia sp.]|nr:DNA polymerase II [Candidatus Kuenenia hertensis]
METINAFILTAHNEDEGNQNYIQLLCASDPGPVEIFIRNKPLFFVSSNCQLPPNIKYLERKVLKLRTFSRENADALYFHSHHEMLQARHLLKSNGIQCYESDIRPEDRFLMERFINGSIGVKGEVRENGVLRRMVNPEIKTTDYTPTFKVLSLDIETNAHTGELYSIALHMVENDKEQKIVIMQGDQAGNVANEEYVHFVPSEKEVVKTFLSAFHSFDPDLIIGWYVVGFDLLFLEKKFRYYKIPFTLGRGNRPVKIEEKKGAGYFAHIDGRVVIDGPSALRNNFYTFENYKLETVARKLLGTGKAIDNEEDKITEINRMFKEDKAALARYNIQDCVLVTDIFKKTSLIPMIVERTKVSGLLMDKIGMTARAFDHFYLPRIHRKGFVAHDCSDVEQGEQSGGGHVIEPVAGIYDHVVVFDFKSLYPSIIRTFKIDPLSRLIGEERKESHTIPSGHAFSSKEHILPEFIDVLMQKREQAKREKNMPMSQAIKILMNSFYGVMGSYGCRFYHPDLPNSITSTGRFLLTETARYLESLDYKVLYGDTDSVFVQLKKHQSGEYADVSSRLAKDLNEYWRKRLKENFHVESFLEIEFEMYFEKLCLPMARGFQGGAKKRYVGRVKDSQGEKLHFVGMEYVRSDWTELAKNFQYQLYERLFNNQEIETFVKDYISDLKKGRYDNDLIYYKRLRKNVREYTKTKPPHVKAAHMLSKEVGEVYYIMTMRGPVPVQLDHKDIDYVHYIDKQIRPIADSVLPLLGKSFDAIYGARQLSLFSS